MLWFHALWFHFSVIILNFISNESISEALFLERSVANTEGNILEIAMATKVGSAFPLEGQEGGESKMAVYLWYAACPSVWAFHTDHATLRVDERAWFDNICPKYTTGLLYILSLVFRHGLIKFRLYQNAFVWLAYRFVSLFENFYFIFIEWYLKSTIPTIYSELHFFRVIFHVKFNPSKL